MSQQMQTCVRNVNNRELGQNVLICQDEWTHFKQTKDMKIKTMNHIKNRNSLNWNGNYPKWLILTSIHDHSDRRLSMQRVKSWGTIWIIMKLPFLSVGRSGQPVLSPSLWYSSNQWAGFYTTRPWLDRLYTMAAAYLSAHCPKHAFYLKLLIMTKI